MRALDRLTGIGMYDIYAFDDGCCGQCQRKIIFNPNSTKLDPEHQTVTVDGAVCLETDMLLV